MNSSKINLRIAIILLLSVMYVLAGAQGWDIPADKKARNSYIKFNEATAREGEAIYTKNCMSCHGNPGKNNSMKSLKPVPPDLSTAKTQQLTDGELFYILNTGRGLMPSFKNVLPEEERWKAIAYIRSFHKQYVQTLSKFDPNKSKLVKINLNYDQRTGKINVDVKAHEKSGTIALKEAEVLLFATRYFGRLQIGKTLRTNTQGMVSFNFPKDLPGDKNGTVELVLKVNDENYGEIESSRKLKIGIPTNRPGLTEQRAIWNVLIKAPVWIICTYTSGVLLVLMLFLYLFFNLNKIRKSATPKN